MIKSSAINLAEENMSNLTSASGDSSSNRNDDNGGIYPLIHQQPLKKKRNQPGHPGKKKNMKIQDSIFILNQESDSCFSFLFRP